MDSMAHEIVICCGK